MTEQVLDRPDEGVRIALGVRRLGAWGVRKQESQAKSREMWMETVRANQD